MPVFEGHLEVFLNLAIFATINLIKLPFLQFSGLTLSPEFVYFVHFKEQRKMGPRQNLNCHAEEVKKIGILLTFLDHGFHIEN